jgi:translation initiation factor 2B subunit (eIF-2B alpha/beta/delta family)
MSKTRTRRRNGVDNVTGRAFASIRTDRVRGASALAEQALESLVHLAHSWSQSEEDQLPGQFRRIATALERAQPAMGPFLRWAVAWRAMARARAPRGRAAMARAWIRSERARLRTELTGLARTSRRRFPNAPHVVTLSRSRSVFVALGASHRRVPLRRVSVLESRPGGEGRVFARELRDAGLPARVVRDRDGPRVVQGADLLLIGADAVFPDGSVVHKVKTRTLAGAAYRAGVPVVVVAARSKFAGQPGPRRPLPARFDRTPARYLTEVWTDRGVWRVRKTRRRKVQSPPL